ncbi:hypothetical protein Z051_00725 [Rhodococcus rhodochrous KG-21]|uniref:Uncharacterized protein n=1 Tax=Rhodococcus rhodochrous KG-21 TaxID=1441923 RepID=A0A0M8PKM5_RHORH|nr:hypothetical protein Z051_00725 [Rhodococcus rhodochrous KG-21]
MNDMTTAWLLLGAFVTAALVIRYLNTASTRPRTRTPLRYVGHRPVTSPKIPVVRYCSPAPTAERPRLSSRSAGHAAPAGEHRDRSAGR